MGVQVGATVAVAGGAISTPVTFTGVVNTAYTVLGVTPSWATMCYVDPASKLSTGFTVHFSTPAPPTGGSFDWVINEFAAAGAASLAQFLDDLRDLLHDPNDVYWSATQKTKYINQGLVKRDRETGQNRVLISFVTTIGVDTYTFTDLGNENVFDMVGLNLLYQNWRYVMGATSFSELNASIRSYSPPFQWAPVAWARYGPAQFVVAPAPAIAYTLEVDCSQVSPRDSLVNLTDRDPLPAPFDAPVKYWAARMAKYNERAYDEAREFEEMFKAEVSALDANKVGMVPSLSGRWGWR